VNDSRIFDNCNNTPSRWSGLVNCITNGSNSSMFDTFPPAATFGTAVGAPPEEGARDDDDDALYAADMN